MPVVLRASSLPTYADCARRAAASLFTRQINEAGFDIRQTKQSIGGIVGTQFHKTAAEVLKARMEGETDFYKLVNRAMKRVDPAEFEQPTEWDQTTPDQEAAESALEKITRAWLPLGMTLQPRAVERELRQDLDDGFELLGHVDVITADGWVRDHKTGHVKPEPQAQLGAYALLAEKHGLGPISHVAADWVKRVGKNTAQVAPVTLQYEAAECKSAANRVVDQIKQDFSAFQQSGNPWEFMANPQTMMCSEKYCPAWGTKFCKMGGP